MDNGGRRGGLERRTFSYSHYIPERRSGSDRRCGEDRRRKRRLPRPPEPELKSGAAQQKQDAPP